MEYILIKVVTKMNCCVVMVRLVWFQLTLKLTNNKVHFFSLKTQLPFNVQRVSSRTRAFIISIIKR